MIRFHTFWPVSTVLTLALAGLASLFVLLNNDQNTVKACHAGQAEAAVTNTHVVYLPTISHEIACVNPPSGTVMIGGRATVHGQPAGSGIPFKLLYSAHWDTRPSYILTTTTRSDGSFCFGPVDMLTYRGSCYIVIFDPAWMPEEDYVSWGSPALFEWEIESGTVYTYTAEIGE